jgi:hypothetical protein
MRKSTHKEGGAGDWWTMLRRHLAAILILKVVVLAGLWFAFIKPYRVAVDAAVMGERLSGQSNSTNKENHNDRFNGR